MADFMHRANPVVRFAFEFWDGETVAYGDQHEVFLRLNSPEGAKHVLRNGFLGFGEAYMAGELDVEGNLQELLRLGFSIGLDRGSLSPWQRIRCLLRFLNTRNSLSRASKNISYHYDLGDDFYSLFLDRSMTYSCAYFNNESCSLEKAQLDKYEHICRKLSLQQGEKMLDIGCGWGGMLIYAAQTYDVDGLGNTISRDQCDFATKKIRELGLQDKINVVLADYRRLTGEFDKFVSIGMFEHVGKAFIPLFMDKIAELLKKGGIGLLHTIGKETASPGDPWTMKYIFPGGYVPHFAEIVSEMGRAGLCILDVENLGFHYARTLDRWAANFEENAEAVRNMFDEPFVRMWRLFLNSASAGFKYGTSRLYQILFTNGLNNELPLTRKHLYRNA